MTDVVPAATVEGNRWDLIPVPEIGAWTPSLLVSVVIPHFEAHEELSRTLAALTRQTYPDDLIEVIVVDDGSVTAPVIPAWMDSVDARVVTQEDLGFGLARARNLGAELARGDIVVFIDCDMMPEAQHIEAHARWHHTVSNALVVGFRFHAEFGHLEPETIADAVERSTLRELVADQTPDRPEWIEGHMDRTHMLTLPGGEGYQVTSGGNLSVRRTFYATIGGTDASFDRWGGEDNEFGYRAVQSGAIVIPERAALCWHQGEGHEPTEAELRSHWLQRPKMQNLIADLAFRGVAPGSTFTVPHTLVEVDGRGAPAEVTADTIVSILGSTFDDLLVVGLLPGDPLEAEWLTIRFSSDPRVDLVDPESDPWEANPFSPLRIQAPARLLFHPNTMEAIVTAFRETGCGLLFSTLPATAPSEARLRAVLTRAYNRCRLIDPESDLLDTAIASLFGQRWVSAGSLGFGFIPKGGERIEPRDPFVSEDDLVDAAVVDHLYARVVELSSRRALRLADALGSLRNARSSEDARMAMRALLSSTQRPTMGDWEE